MPVALVEDVITTGGQVVKSTEDLRRRGALSRRDVLCVIDRSNGAHDKLEAAGLNTGAVFTGADLDRAAAMERGRPS